MTLPSLTYWNRVEPRPRSMSVKRSLAAEVRDPVWFLTRQWQFGEYRGQDAASAAYVQISARLGHIDGWRPLGGDLQPFDGGAPLEPLVETELFSPDVATAVELGQKLEAFLREEGAGGLIPDFRDAYRIPRPSEADLAAMADQELARFLRVCAGRAIDGVELHEAARVALPGLPADPPVGTGDEPAVRRAVSRFVAWVAATLPGIGRADATTWVPERLEYGVEITATTPDGGRATLTAHAGRRGEFDWHAFDARTGAAEPRDDVEGEAVTAITRSLLPINVRFRGMPNARWWHFEHGPTDFGKVEPDRRELGKLIVLDFMLVHSNDWFVLPFTQAVGTLCRIDALLVHDVFGTTTVVGRADHSGTPGERWSMFSTSVEGDPSQLADYLILAPSAAATTLTGELLEEVRFLRDEMANMVWAIEEATENGLGQKWRGHERVFAAPPAEPPVPVAPAAAPVAYRIQTGVPAHWIPFVPVRIDQARRDVALERAAMLRPIPGAPPEPIRPVGRVLQPTGLADPAVYQIREEEVPRAGTRVTRLPRLSRWTDGSTHLWVARSKQPGAGEGGSGLRFDMAEPTQQPQVTLE